MKKLPKQFLVSASLGCVFAASIAPVHAGFVFSIEGPGVQATSVSPVVTETFDSKPVGAFSGSVLGGQGTLSSGGAVVAGTASGGAFGGAGNGNPGSETQFFAVGAQSGNAGPVTLTLTTPQKYFGMWWPAGDAQNTLSFFDSADNLLANYTVATILASLPAGYNGNPNNGLNTGEKYAYLNFTATGTDSIKKVVFGNNGSVGTGYEMDNFSITDQPITPPGTVVPEPSTYIAGALLLLPFGFRFVRNLRSR